MFGSSVPNGILTNFSGTIIKDMGFSTFDAALLDCAGRSFQIISLIIAGLVANYVKNARMAMVTVGNVVCVIATALLSFLPTENHWGRLVSFWFVNVQSIGFTLGLVMISSNFGGYSKRSITSAMVFAAYCAGNMAGPQVRPLAFSAAPSGFSCPFLPPRPRSSSPARIEREPDPSSRRSQFIYANEKPRYQSGAYAMMAGYIAKLVAHLALWAIMYLSNKSRDRKFGPADPKLAAAAGMEDKTESVKSNPYVSLTRSLSLAHKLSRVSC